MGYEIHKTLVVSTGHIEESDSNQLAKDATSNTTPSIVVYEYGIYGHIVFIPSYFYNKEDVSKRYSKEFMYLLEITRAEDCTHLRIDRDGPIYEHLPTFIW